jgi:hypothetical protein
MIIRCTQKQLKEWRIYRGNNGVIPFLCLNMSQLILDDSRQECWSISKGVPID